MDGVIRNGMVVFPRNWKRKFPSNLRRKFPRGESFPEIGKESFPVNNLDLQKLTEYVYYGLNRGKRKASRDKGYEAQVMLVTSLKASKLKDS